MSSAGLLFFIVFIYFTRLIVRIIISLTVFFFFKLYIFFILSKGVFSFRTANSVFIFFFPYRTAMLNGGGWDDVHFHILTIDSESIKVNKMFTSLYVLRYIYMDTLCSPNGVLGLLNK